jgi:hypothetical protein
MSLSRGQDFGGIAAGKFDGPGSIPTRPTMASGTPLVTRKANTPERAPKHSN